MSTKRIVIAPIGTRGDVQPGVALGLALQSRGHRVTVAAPSNFQDFVASRGLEFRPVTGDFRDWMRRLRTTPFLDLLANGVEEQFSSLLPVATGADVLVGGMLQLAGPSVAEYYGIPYLPAFPAPVFVRSTELPPVTEPRQDMSHSEVREAWRRRSREWNDVLHGPVNQQRRRIGLAPVRDIQNHVLHSGHVLLAYEPVLGGTPRFDAERVSVTGTWFMDEGPLCPRIEAFCAVGPPPIYVGFGSMVNFDSQRLLATIAGMAATSPTRFIVTGGWASPDDSPRLPASCLVIPEAPLDKLLPLCRAAVHHGGAGTVAAAAAAGIPQAVCPFFADQPFWGARVHRLGLGPAPLPAHLLDAERLEQMAATLTEDQGMLNNAANVAGQICRDRGVRTAADLIDRL